MSLSHFLCASVLLASPNTLLRTFLSLGILSEDRFNSGGVSFPPVAYL